MRAALLLVLLVSCAREPAYVVHPAPKEPVYLDPARYDAVRRDLPAVPAKGSELQAQDEAELLRRQAARSKADCRAAASEVGVSLANFFGAPRGPLDDATTRRLSAFIEQVRNDGDYFIQKMKEDHPRERPFKYIAGLEPCVPREVSRSYPSGHATLARLMALVVGDLYPDKRAALDARAQEIATHRVVVGMHHPTDIEAGRVLADTIYEELKRSPKFKADFEALRP